MEAESDFPLRRPAGDTEWELFIIYFYWSTRDLNHEMVYGHAETY
uniref:Uncharacterized protein n=1 Tax=Anguilla anguilla TaxID=7936 RepID=A0A0E9SG71_ANGAN